MPFKKKIQYMSEEHKETRNEVRLELEAKNPIPTGNLNVAQFEYYLELRKSLIAADRNYASQLPKENPTLTHLGLARRLYDILPSDKLF